MRSEQAMHFTCLTAAPLESFDSTGMKCLIHAAVLSRLPLWRAGGSTTMASGSSTSPLGGSCLTSGVTAILSTTTLRLTFKFDDFVRVDVLATEGSTGVSSGSLALREEDPLGRSQKQTGL